MNFESHVLINFVVVFATDKLTWKIFLILFILEKSIHFLLIDTNDIGSDAIQ